MIEITESQASILEKFLEYEELSKDSENGLTGGSLGKRGINRKTFTDNLAFLEEHYLIYKNFEEQHGIQNWKFYRIFPFGALSYYLWKIRKYPTKEIKISKKFFPLIHDYYPKLKKWFGNEVNYCLRNALMNLDLEPYFIYTNEKDEIIGTSSQFKFFVHSRSFTFSEEYDFLGLEHTINFIDKNGNIVKKEKEYYKNPDELLDWLVYLFFDALLFGIDSIHRKNPIRYKVSNPEMFATQKVQSSAIMEDSKFIPIIENAESQLENHKKYDKKLYDLIKKDTKLMKTLDNKFQVIMEEMKASSGMIKTMKNFLDS